MWEEGEEEEAPCFVVEYLGKMSMRSLAKESMDELNSMILRGTQLRSSRMHTGIIRRTDADNRFLIDLETASAPTFDVEIVFHAHGPGGLPIFVFRDCIDDEEKRYFFAFEMRYVASLN